MLDVSCGEVPRRQAQVQPCKAPIPFSIDAVNFLTANSAQCSPDGLAGRYNLQGVFLAGAAPGGPRANPRTHGTRFQCGSK